MLKTESSTENYTFALDNGTVISSNVPWTVTYVEPQPGFQLSVRFIDGTAGHVEMREMIFSEGAGVFTALRDPAAFANVFVEDGAVTWANGLDIAPDAIHDDIQTDVTQSAPCQRNHT